MLWRTLFHGEVGFIPAPVDLCSPHLQCPMRVLWPADTCQVAEGVGLPLAMPHQPKPPKYQKLNTAKFLCSSESAAGPDNARAPSSRYDSAAQAAPVWCPHHFSHKASCPSQEEAGGLHTTHKKHTVTSDRIAHWPELVLCPCLGQVELEDVGMSVGTQGSVTVCVAEVEVQTERPQTQEVGDSGHCPPKPLTDFLILCSTLSLFAHLCVCTTCLIFSPYFDSKCHV